jgi:FixJ family two-component response regulator
MDVDSSAVLGRVAATICVVDDDPSMLRALERLLLSVGLPAQLFREPLVFLKYATLNPVTVTVIDIWLPGMSGLELQKELRVASPKTRVIVVTADDEDSVRSVAMQNGATGFFAKPFDNEIFLDAIQQAMASAADSWFDTSVSPALKQICLTPAHRADDDRRDVVVNPVRPRQSPVGGKSK